MDGTGTWAGREHYGSGSVGITLFDRLSSGLTWPELNAMSTMNMVQDLRSYIKYSLDLRAHQMSYD
jgi:hypothetical protein